MRKELNLQRASSMEDGIMFYSNLHKNYVAVATVNDNGIITAEWTTRHEYSKHSSAN